MFFNSKSKNAKKDIEKLFSDIQMNLENNYKDLAIKSLKEARLKLEEVNSEGLLKEKEYNKYEEKLSSFEKRMEGYSHRLKVNW